MKSRPRISIIVPVYKAEAYLHRCIDSLLVQTFTDFEVILIDDGSPDKSGAICDTYAKCDERVRVIHQANGGVSAARQKGQDEAIGEYTIHADPDDWVEPTMLEELYQKAKEEDADMVICDYYVNNGERQRLVKQRPSKLDSKTVLRELFQQLHGSCCNKLVRRVCYSNYGVRFQSDMSLCEDLYVNVALLQNNLRIAYLAKAFYHYVQIDTSITNRITPQRIEYLFFLKDKFSNLIESESDKKIAMQSFDCSIVRYYFWGHILTDKEFQAKCGKYKKTVLRRNRSPLSVIYYLSCCGLYSLLYTLASAIKKYKNKV